MLFNKKSYDNNCYYKKWRNEGKIFKRKNIIISLISIIFLFISIIVINYSSYYSYTYEKDGVKFAIKVDGVVQTNFPSKGLYRANVACENATCKWLYDEWKLAIENITGNVSCDIDFVTIEKNNLNNYIIGLVGTTQGNGQVINENGYRYEGKNPNNYVWFNNELWRIIGVFDSASHGQDNNLVKIKRVNSIGGLVWDKSNSNDWTTASLNSLLNGAYLNAQDGTDSGYCYIYSTSVQANCDYKTYGIQDRYRGMIQNVTWYLGGCSDASATAETFYGYERGTEVYSGNSTSTTGYIGLMYPSDYGYSVLSSSCTRTTNLNSYSSSSCGGKSWMTENGYGWLLSPTVSKGFFILDRNGRITSGLTYDANSVYPVLYLKSDVYYVDGDGSILDPIIIGE